MTVKPLTIVWFRQDLRIGDNPALVAAVKSGSLLPIYIVDDENAAEARMGAASRVWLHHSLEKLNQSLEGHLQFFSGDALAIIRQLNDVYNISAVYWNRCYEPWRITRDSRIKKYLHSNNIAAHSFNASLLWEPWTVLKKDATPYKVFTPFYQKGCLSVAPPRPPLAMPKNIDYFTRPIESSCSMDDLNLIPEKNWYRTVLNHWEAGEKAAQNKLDIFCVDCLSDYKRGRDFPATNATSTLSPHLHFGEISPHQVWQRMEMESMQKDFEGVHHFKREIAWREFSYYQLYHFPELAEKPFNARFDAFEWQNDELGLRQWQQGKTGFPIIDAGMRELWQTGTMHNRVRMIVASFLVKNQLIHWRKGAAWFWDCLFDADLASNSASWQWCAGSGADAAPYFRIFNPVLQSEKFDPRGEYIGRYCPELNNLPLKYRHKPWQASDDELLQAGVKLGVDYPHPILDLKATRERALARFKALRR